MRSVSSCFVLVALLGCGAPSPHLTTAPDASAHDGPMAEKPAGKVGVASTADARLGCAATAFRHAEPSFCVDLPAEVAGVAPLATESGVLFRSDDVSVAVQWTPRSNAKLVASWQRPRGLGDQGTFAVLKTEPMPRGAFSLVHDATQSGTLAIFRVPSLSGVAVIESGEHVIRCAAVVHLQREGDVTAVAKARSAALAACKSIRA